MSQQRHIDPRERQRLINRLAHLRAQEHYESERRALADEFAAAEENECAHHIVAAWIAAITGAGSPSPNHHR
jgi:hypothetical protein